MAARRLVHIRWVCLELAVRRNSVKGELVVCKSRIEVVGDSSRKSE